MFLTAEIPAILCPRLLNELPPRQLYFVGGRTARRLITLLRILKNLWWPLKLTAAANGSAH